MSSEPVDKSVHRKMIRAIDVGWGDMQPFSPRDIENATGASRNAVGTVLRALVSFGLLKRSAKAYKGRHYSIGAAWSNAAEVIDIYEMEMATRV